MAKKYLLINEFKLKKVTVPVTKAIVIEQSSVDGAIASLAYELTTSDSLLAQAVRSGDATSEVTAAYELASDRNLLEEVQ
ncbi:hypothetical protein [Levilactobacillus wangkuiensis]|uniref:hypothetical protein n=1 Tax=Levilactobacillus wangkuiensis TaxID=2799566 RepID=UPI001941A974|nr:hypothetical protein [Levilactobacillus wangkuiensis]